jgi:hypothetical protein
MSGEWHGIFTWDAHGARGAFATETLALQVGPLLEKP